MTETENRIALAGGKNYFCENDSEAYRIVSGPVLVYIAPITQCGTGRRSFLYEAGEGEIIPSFHCRDSEYNEWCFCFSALEKAEIEILEYGSTKRLRDTFSHKIQLRNYEEEGYNGALLEQYRYQLLKEDILIKRNRNSKTTTYSETLNIIADTFRKGRVSADTERTGNLLYDCMALLCDRCGVGLAPYEKIKEACGENFTVEDMASISGFSFRRLTLSPGWEKQDNGALIVFRNDGAPMVCLPNGTKLNGSHSYILVDAGNYQTFPLTSKVNEAFSTTAYMIYRPLPSRKLEIKDLFSFGVKSFCKSDVITFLALTVITAIIGLITPTISQKLFDEYIPLGDKGYLLEILYIMISFMLANILISVVKNLLNYRISSGVTNDINSAVYERVFRMPESFFRKFESADLAKRISGIGSIVSTMCGIIIGSAVSAVYLILYFFRMQKYSSKLSAIGITIIIIYGICYYFLSRASLKHSAVVAELDGSAGSKLFQFLSGIQKIRIAGVEDRALYEYLKPTIKLRERLEKCSRIKLYNGVLSSASGMIISVLFYISAKNIITDTNGVQEMSVGTFSAFLSIFGCFEASMLGLLSEFITLKTLKPLYERFRPIMETEPEYSEIGELPGDISGEIEINNVSFAYAEDEPIVLKNINLNIGAGEYVGIVGQSGCGKSTLMKLLLGFEKPSSGQIYYDNKDIESLDKRELRRKMGVVLQEGRLISGSIFENITITAPNATADDVLRVIRAVGLEEDINKMPMGLFTHLNEDCNTISGGQQQRILIARALISSPKILIFDEATAALDNVTQSMVSKSLDEMNITRIVIAHRLSTIEKCNRIIVMDNGRIAEEGTYSELIEKGGIFSQLARRQMV